MYKEQLQSLGLTGAQAEIYDFLSQTGPSTASKIAKHTSIKRSMVYVVLEELVSEKLVIKNEQLKVARFRIGNPTHIKELLTKKATEFERATQAYQAIEHPLIQQFEVQSGQPGVRFFVGIEGLKALYKDLNKSGVTEIYLVRSNQQPEEAMFEVIKEQVAHQIRQGIKVYVVNSSGDADLSIYIERDAAQNTERRIIAKETFQNPAQILIYGNKVGFTTYRSPMITTLIENEDIATTILSLYRYLWKQSVGETNMLIKKLT